MKKITLAGLTAVLVLALAPAAFAQDAWIANPDPASLCREVNLGALTEWVCVEVGTNKTIGTGATVAPFVRVTCGGEAACNQNRSVGTTGFLANPAFPLPEVILGSATVRHPGGNLGTLYASGLAVPLDVPSFCVGSKEDCPGGDVIIAPL